MEKPELTKEIAIEILHKNMQNTNLRRHCYAVGKALATYFDYYKSENRETGNLTKGQWEITGILHDADWELTANQPEKHTILTMDWLKYYETPQEMLNVFRSHNNKTTHLREPETLLEWTLECCDELTGFIVAVTLVRPERKLEFVTVESVLKKFKQKEFARQVDREQILQCESKLNIPAEKFIEVTLRAMQEYSELLGL